jgi:ribonucleoside-diphosphate reductase alpha chain
MAQFPSKEIAELSYIFSTLGPGYANLGAALMVQGAPTTAKKGVPLPVPSPPSCT